MEYPGNLSEEETTEEETHKIKDDSVTEYLDISNQNALPDAIVHSSQKSNNDIPSLQKCHMCDICNKRFRKLKSLVQHKKQHDFGISNDIISEANDDTNDNEEYEEVNENFDGMQKQTNNKSVNTSEEPNPIASPTKSSAVTQTKKAKRANLMDKINKLSTAVIQSDTEAKSIPAKTSEKKEDIISDLLEIQDNTIDKISSIPKNDAAKIVEVNEKENKS